MDCLVVVPTYNHLDYGLAAARSLLAADPRTAVYVVDDASPEWTDQTCADFQRLGPADRIYVNRFPANGGLTRSWNHGLSVAREMGFPYAVCGNSDILASPNCMSRMIAALDSFDLVGPVTNAPGRTCPDLQGVWSYFADEATDAEESRRRVAEQLAVQRHGHRLATKINGFFMLAKTETWWRGAFDADHVYDPKNHLIGNEDELQDRWKAAGLKSGLALDAYVYHYRSVSRKTRLTRGWARRSA